MPGESSLYRKIQVVLEVAKSVRVETAAELRDEVGGVKPDNFLTRQYDHNKDAFVAKISETSIRRAVDFCQRLGLIEETGELTDAGRQALRKTQFDRVIASQARDYLHHAGISLAKINRTISSNLRSDPPVLSTSRELWLASGSKVNYSIFSRMLTLLSECGGAHSSQKKIYLHVEE
jgi:NTP pyrophosphatase (non-canonical NTP hydrolase)